MIGSVLEALVIVLVVGSALVQVVTLAGRPALGTHLRRAVEPTRFAVTALGWLALIIGVDFAAGSAWTAWRGEPQEPSRQVSVTVEGQIPRDPRADSPAYDGYPWVKDYLEELQVPRYDYKPYLIGQLRTIEGRYVNTESGVRQSYQPAGASASDAVEIWFFGGSTLYGEGQRDDFTIPSQIARMAEGEGLVVRPVNMGHQGQLLWQEMLRFEMEIARRGPPDLAVFYDGTNDYNYQLDDQRGHPTHGDIASARQQLTGPAQPLPSQLAPPAISIWDRLHKASLLRRVVEQFGAVSFVPAAGAAPSDAVDGSPDPLVRDVAAVYERSVGMARAVAEASEVPALFFWQPIKDPSPRYVAIADELPEGVIDITDAYDGVSLPIFIDGGHTNELGARVVAEAMYDWIRPQRVAAAGREP